MPVPEVRQMPAQQPDFLSIDACLKQAFSFDRDLTVELAPSCLIAGTIAPKQPIQVRQPSSPIRHDVVHKQILILLEPKRMIAASLRFTMRNDGTVNDINVVNFTCYWDVKSPTPAACGARFARSSGPTRLNRSLMPLT
jgi:hypothetical protein